MLDDETTRLLGNAILLGYCVQILKRRHWNDIGLVRELHQAEADERYYLDDALQVSGYIHSVFSSFHGELTGELESVSEVYKKWQELALSDDPVAKLRLKDVDFSGFDAANPITFMLTQATPQELVTPICRLGPTELTRTLARVVIERCLGTDAPLEVAEDLDQVDHSLLEPIASSDAAQNTSPKKPRRNANRERYKPALDECWRRAKEVGPAAEAFPVAESVVDDWGWILKKEWTKDCRKVPGAHREAACKTLGRKFRSALKEIENQSSQGI